MATENIQNSGSPDGNAATAQDSSAAADQSPESSANDQLILTLFRHSESSRYWVSGQANDRAGAVFVANGIVKAHQQYLALGGTGFLLGDGGLTYGPEEIFEAFYTAHVWRGFFVSADAQHIDNPGYNRARGPVLVPGLRLHVDF